jgi:hypothetical protein
MIVNRDVFSDREFISSLPSNMSRDLKRLTPTPSEHRKLVPPLRIERRKIQSGIVDDDLSI